MTGLPSRPSGLSAKVLGEGFKDDASSKDFISENLGMRQVRPHIAVTRDEIPTNGAYTDLRSSQRHHA